MAVKTFNGKIKRVFFKKLDAADQYGNEFRSSLQLDDAEGTWVGFGGSKKDKFTIKEGKGYYDVQEGDTIFLKYEDNGKYKNAKKSDLTVIEKNVNPSVNNASNSPKNDSKAQPNATTQGSSQKANNGSTGAKSTKIFGDVKSISEGQAVVFDPKLDKDVQIVLGEHISDPKLAVGGRLAAYVDAQGNITSGFKAYDAVKKADENIGMLRCHANNGATTLCISSNLAFDTENLIECAKVVHTVTSSCKLWFAQTDIGKTMDERELGNTVGNAVLSACYYSTKYNLEQNVMGYLETTVPAVTDFIKNGNIEQKKEEPVAVNVQETNTEPFVSDQDFDDLDPPEDPFDFDESIPFAPIGLQYRELLNCM